jgi:hypothetical protein
MSEIQGTYQRGERHQPVGGVVTLRGSQDTVEEMRQSLTEEKDHGPAAS